MGNVLGDVFYPDNPKRRSKVIQLTQQIADYMKQNFRATNNLTNFLKESNVEGAANFNPIAVDENQTLQYNSRVLQNRIIEVQKIIEKIDKTLADQLDPALYRNLQNVDLSFQDRLQDAKKATTIVTGVILAATTIAVCAAIASGGLLAPVVAVLGIVYLHDFFSSLWRFKHETTILHVALYTNILRA